MEPGEIPKLPAALLISGNQHQHASPIQDQLREIAACLTVIFDAHLPEFLGFARPRPPQRQETRRERRSSIKEKQLSSALRRNSSDVLEDLSLFPLISVVIELPDSLGVDESGERRVLNFSARFSHRDPESIPHFC
jgi:hypothetical protein